MLTASSNPSTNSQAPDESEMLRSSDCLTNLASESSHSVDSSSSDNTISDPLPNHSIYAASRPAGHRNDLISNFKQRLKPNRSDMGKREGSNSELNEGFLLVDQSQLELIFIPSDQMDLQHTRHAEPCVHGEIDDDHSDTNENQSMSMTPLTPSLLPPTQSSRTITSSTLLSMSHSATDTDIQATQAGVECTARLAEVSNAEETQGSLTNSSSSTNSSNTDGQLTSADRTGLDDDNYVQVQQHDLDRISYYEIALSDERRDEQRELEDHEDFDLNRNFSTAVDQNSNFKGELKRLQDNRARTNAPWSCEVCTYTNQAYIITGRDVCDMCEGPSPLKRHTLTS